MTHSQHIRRDSSSTASDSSSSSYASSSSVNSTMASSSTCLGKPSGLTGQPLKRVFFSPHPDDIAYSCFGTVTTKTTSCCCSRKSSTKTPVFTLQTDIATPPASPNNGSDSYFTKADDSKYSRSPSPPLLSPSLSLSFGAHKETWKHYAPTRRAQREGLDLAGSRVAGSTAGDVVVTVFTTSRCANGEIGKRLLHSVHHTTTLRADEDDAFARNVNADLIWLGFPDSSARDESSRRPELGVQARGMAPGSLITSVNHAIFDKVRQALVPIVLEAIASEATMYLPLGVGCHVDHWMTRVAVLSIIDELVQTSPQTNAAAIYGLISFYEDLPYADQTTPGEIEELALAVLPEGARATLNPLTRVDWERKSAAIQAYASQMKPTILPSIYGHAVNLARNGAETDPFWLDRVRRSREQSTSQDTEIIMAERLWRMEGCRVRARRQSVVQSWS